MGGARSRARALRHARRDRRRGEAEARGHVHRARRRLARDRCALPSLPSFPRRSRPRAEKFEQAITDYETGLALKESLLPPSSRQLAEAHYKLGLVLDLTSGRLADAIVHVRRALDCTDARLSELRTGLAAAPAVADVKMEAEDAKADVKGKGKAGGRKLVRDAVSGMSKGQIEGEIKELEEVIAELKLKVRSLRPSLSSPGANALSPPRRWRSSRRRTTTRRPRQRPRPRWLHRHSTRR